MVNEGALLIGEALRYNTSLKKLFLQDNDIDAEGARGFATSLYSCDLFVLEQLEGVELQEFSRIFDILPTPGLNNDQILSAMKKRRGKNAKKTNQNN